jgi:glyoxylase-like metal-dependent hydrolase (beta-lactamase superfamily II)
MILETLIVGALQVNCYLLGCEQTRRAVVIDPGDSARAIQAVLRRHNLTVDRIVVTHGHFDHLLAAHPLQEATGAPFFIHEGDAPLLEMMQRTSMAWLGYDPGSPPQVSGYLQPGDVIEVGEIALELRATPGHSAGGVTLVDYAGRRAFTGDALFRGSIGRTDLDGDFPTLLDSIRSQILTLPDDFAVLSGHGPATTVGEERETNPFLMGPYATPTPR